MTTRDPGRRIAAGGGTGRATIADLAAESARLHRRQMRFLGWAGAAGGVLAAAFLAVAATTPPAPAPARVAVPAGPPDPVALATAAVRRGAYADSPVVPGSARVIEGGGDPVGVPVATLLDGKSVPLDAGHLRGEGRRVVVGLLEYDGGRRPFLVYLRGPEVLDVDVLSP